jgi:hypothetical protein
MLYKQRHWMDCLVCCFTHHFALTYEEMIAEIGHDGRGGHVGTDQQRGFHVQEFIEVGLRLGFAVSIIDREYVFALPTGQESCYPSGRPLRDYLARFSGVLEVEGSVANHALLWDAVSAKVSDPREPEWKPLENDLEIISFYSVVKYDRNLAIKSN